MWDRSFVGRLTLYCCAMSLGQTPQFQSKVDVVLVPVVVRDSHGKPIGNLTQSDFLLFDKGKQQSIASFEAVRRRGTVVSATADPVSFDVEKPRSGETARENDEGRYLIYLFDDLNIRFADMAIIRAAAVRHFQNGL